MSISPHKLRKLLEASEIIHAHDQGPFHERLFRASTLLFQDVCHTFEVYDLESGKHSVESDMPFPETRREELMRRGGELVPLDHPIFPFLVRQDPTVRRMSDLISQRKLQCTDLYQEVFKVIDVGFQIGIPVFSESHTGGLSINRGGRDFSDEDMAVAELFARQLLIAHRNEQILKASMLPAQKCSQTNFAGLRDRGLTRRECEVLWWVAQGKRDAEIGIILGISPRTASVHVRSILTKLSVETRTAAAALVGALYPP
jgi:DNA-binding CsgD family transcriptional regulator